MAQILCDYDGAIYARPNDLQRRPDEQSDYAFNRLDYGCYEPVDETRIKEHILSL